MTSDGQNGLAEPRLIATRAPGDATAAVIVLHGGGGRGTVPVSPTQPSVLRMIPVAARLAHAGRGKLAVYRLLNATRGFGHDPLVNVRWALNEVRQLVPGRPIGLIGHSLGGSVALRAAGSSGVTAVVALAPWISGVGEGPAPTVPTLIVHGDRDRVTNCAASRESSEAARRAGAPVAFVEVRGGEHTMLRRMSAFDGLASSFAVAVLTPALRPTLLNRRWDRIARQALANPRSVTV